MNKAQYKQAYRLSRMNWKAYLEDDKIGKRLIKRAISQHFTHIEFLYAECSRIMSYEQFTTAYSEPIYSFNPEYTSKSHKIITERQFKRRLQEIYKN